MTRLVSIEPNRWFMFLVIALAFWTSNATATAETQPSKDWVIGFATGLLEREFSVEVSEIRLRKKSLSVWLSDRPNTLHLDTVVRSLLEIERVEHVRLYDTTEPLEPIAEGRDDSPTEACGEGSLPPCGWNPEYFPIGRLFEPPVADPRWPRSTVGVQSYLDDPELNRAATVSFGETFSLVRFAPGESLKVDVGFQGGVFSVFDLDSESFDLVNSDFLGALFASLRSGRYSADLRFYHQSSHLGDEYLLRTDADRVNLSFEVAEVLLAVDVTDWLRLYGGGGILVHREPALDRGLTQFGFDFESPDAFLSGWLRPLVSLDVQFREEGDWSDDLSLRSGFQIEHPRFRRLKLRLLGEYYRGRSPNGQFFVRRIETVGVSLGAGF